GSACHRMGHPPIRHRESEGNTGRQREAPTMTAPNLIEFRPGSHASMRTPIPLIPARAGYEHLTARERLEIPAAASREALIQRLEAVGELAPDAPLSFLVVTIHGL